MIFSVRINKYLGLILGGIFFLHSPNSKAETFDLLTKVPPPSPRIESLDRPSSNYSLGSVIPYQIRVRWPSPAIEEVRMSSPDLTLENLELIGVSQETISGPEESASTDQILTFNFKGQKPGLAKIKRFTLKWIQSDGASTSELAIPPLELTITQPQNWWLIIFLSVGGATALGGLGFLFWTLSQKEKPIPQNVDKSQEDLILEDLSAAQQRWETNSHHQEFLNELNHLIGQYAAQKLGWNPSQEDYNALQKKAESKWSKKEASAFIELFRTLEYERFSGTVVEPNRLTKLYRTIYSFIEHKKII